MPSERERRHVEHRYLAAQLWCEPQHAHKEMDGDLAESIASLLDQQADAALSERDKENAARDQEMFVDLRAQLATAQAAITNHEEAQRVGRANGRALRQRAAQAEARVQALAAERDEIAQAYADTPNVQAELLQVVIERDDLQERCEQAEQRLVDAGALHLADEATISQLEQRLAASTARIEELQDQVERLFVDLRARLATEREQCAAAQARVAELETADHDHEACIAEQEQAYQRSVDGVLERAERAEAREAALANEIRALIRCFTYPEMRFSERQAMAHAEALLAPPPCQCSAMSRDMCADPRCIHRPQHKDLGPALPTNKENL